MKTVRERLVEWLYERNFATTSEIAKALGLSTADTRHHLAILRAQGVVDIVGERSRTSSGRPPKLFALRKMTSAHNLDKLSGVLLKIVLAQDNLPQNSNLIRQVARALANCSGELPTNPTRRIYSSIDLLNSMNYRASWEARAPSPHIIFNHCPYRAIIDEHPELCKLDKLLLEELTKQCVVQTEKLVKTPGGISQCRFIIG
jgi:predicted ArsR family transcriptional regulator